MILPERGRIKRWFGSSGNYQSQTVNFSLETFLPICYCISCQDYSLSDIANRAYLIYFLWKILSFPGVYSAKLRLQVSVQWRISKVKSVSSMYYMCCYIYFLILRYLLNGLNQKLPVAQLLIGVLTTLISVLNWKNFRNVLLTCSYCLMCASIKIATSQKHLAKSYPASRQSLVACDCPVTLQHSNKFTKYSGA